MPNILEVSNSFLNKLDARQADALEEIQKIYAPVLEVLTQELAKVVTKIERAQRSGKEVSKATLYESFRLTYVLEQFVKEIRKLNTATVGIINSAQKDAVEIALESSEALIRSSLGKLPTEVKFDRAFLTFDQKAAEQIVARFSQGSPLRKSLEASIPDGVDAIERLFVQAIVQGQPAKALINPLVTRWGMSQVRAETTARTEIVSSYRNGNLVRFQESEVVKQWQWSATLDNRTCPICVYMDGQIFDLEVPFATHPSCRCSPIPVTKTWKELGIDFPEYEKDFGLRGEEWFAIQSDAVKLEILHIKKFELYKAGEITLKDLTQYFEHPVYGPSREERSIKDLRRLKILQ